MEHRPTQQLPVFPRRRAIHAFVGNALGWDLGEFCVRLGLPDDETIYEQGEFRPIFDRMDPEEERRPADVVSLAQLEAAALTYATTQHQVDKAKLLAAAGMFAAGPARLAGLLEQTHAAGVTAGAQNAVAIIQRGRNHCAAKKRGAGVAGDEERATHYREAFEEALHALQTGEELWALAEVESEG